MLTPFDGVANRVVIVAPANVGSAGDEAMLVAICEALIRKGREVVVFSGVQGWGERLKSYDICVDEVVIKRMFRGLRALFVFRAAIKKIRPSEFYVIGADVMDGYYSDVASVLRLTLLQIVSRCCTTVRLVGFSFSDEPSQSVCKKIKEVAKLGVCMYARDPVSAQRLERLGVPVVLSADLAFLLEPSPSSGNLSHCLDAVRQCRAQQGSVIAVNINAIHYGLEGEVFLDKVFATIESLVGESMLVMLVPHDNRTVRGESDFSLADAMAKRLASVNINSVVAPSTLLAGEAKFLASLADFVITGRMHFAIAAISQGVPAVMYSYQGKQEGLLQHVGLNPSEYIMDYKSSGDAMEKISAAAFANREQAKASILEVLPKVKRLAALSLQ